MAIAVIKLFTFADQEQHSSIAAGEMAYWLQPWFNSQHPRGSSKSIYNSASSGLDTKAKHSYTLKSYSVVFNVDDVF